MGTDGGQSPGLSDSRSIVKRCQGVRVRRAVGPPSRPRLLLAAAHASCLPQPPGEALCAGALPSVLMSRTPQAGEPSSA